MLESVKITRILRDSDVLKASAVLGIEYSVLAQLNDRALLNTEYIRETLIREDFRKLTSGLRYLVERNNAYSYPEVTDAVCKHWDITKRQLRDIVKKKNVQMAFCPNCGKRVEPIASKRTGGLCADCFTESLNLLDDNGETGEAN